MEFNELKPGQTFKAENQTCNTDDTDLIPVLKVIDDMYSDTWISYPATEYSKQHDATEEEIKLLEREEKITAIFSYIFLCLPIILFIICAIMSI